MIIGFLIAILSFSPHILAGEKLDRFLMGSVVKSEEWEIDRKKNIEYFKKNVYFKNYYYTMKSDYAVYDRNKQTWDVKGGVYCKKKFDDGSWIEMYCDRGVYLEKDEKANLFSDNRVKMVYFDFIKKEFYVSYSKKALADNNYKKIFFKGDFEVKISSLTAYSEEAVYDDMEKTFILNSKPSALGFNQKYKVYIQSEKIKLNKMELSVSAEKNVFGVLKPFKNKDKK